MDSIDKVVFGDNQFFGINHMSQEKAQQLSEKFYTLDSVIKVYDTAFECGVKAIMLNSNDRAAGICDVFRSKKSQYQSIQWYPSIPYPHKYANLVAEKGIMAAINDILFKNNSAAGVLGMITKGSAAIVTKDAIALMKMLVDMEMKIFKGLNIRVVFLQNIVTDLILGLELKDVFYEYCQYITKKYDAIPGLITQNLPKLKNALEDWDIKNVVICSSINKIGYLMSPNVDLYADVIKTNNSNDYQLMAMSTLAAGAIPAKEAYEFINELKPDSVVFGASSRQHIEETIGLIRL